MPRAGLNRPTERFNHIQFPLSVRSEDNQTRQRDQKGLGNIVKIVLESPRMTQKGE
jgi:hypothetical protein